MSTLEERSAARRRQMVANLAHSPNEAEAWDLAFWQQAGPEARLSALVDIHEEVAKVEAARLANCQTSASDTESKCSSDTDSGADAGTDADAGSKAGRH